MIRTNLHKLLKVKSCCKDITDQGDIKLVDTIFKGYTPILRSYKNGKTDYASKHIGIKENNLTDCEALSILSYTGSLSKWINSDLRIGNKVECACKIVFIENLDHSLSQLNPFNNRVVFRMDSPSDTDCVLIWFNENKGIKVNVPYFLSTSKNVFDTHNDVTWEIMTMHRKSLSRDISNISNNKNEEEVVFKANSYFIIEKVNFETKKIYLKETIYSEASIPLTGLYYLNN